MERVPVITRLGCATATRKLTLALIVRIVVAHFILTLMDWSAMVMANASKATMNGVNGLEYANAKMAGLARVAMSIIPLLPSLKPLPHHPSGKHHMPSRRVLTSPIPGSTSFWGQMATLKGDWVERATQGTRVQWTLLTKGITLARLEATSPLRRGLAVQTTMLVSTLQMWPVPRGSPLPT